MIILMLLYMIVGFGIMIYGTILSDTIIGIVGGIDVFISTLIYNWGCK